MEISDLAATLWETLLDSRVPRDAATLTDVTGSDPAAVRTALVALRDAGLIDIAQPVPRTYRARVMLDAWAWARAVDLGIPLLLLERRATMCQERGAAAAHPEAIRRKALLLASSGEVDRARSTSRAAARSRLEADRRGRIQSHLAVTEIGRLVQDARQSLDRFQASSATSDPQAVATAMILEQMVTEGSRSLAALERTLLAARPVVKDKRA